jgi:hypothetical protein
MTTYTYDELSGMSLGELENHKYDIMNDFQDYCDDVDFFIEEQRKFEKREQR